MGNHYRNMIFLFIGVIAFIIFYNTVIGGHYNRKIMANQGVVCGNITDIRTGKGPMLSMNFPITARSLSTMYPVGQ